MVSWCFLITDIYWRMEFVDEMKQLFQEIENETILPGHSSSLLCSEFWDPIWSFGSPIRNSSGFMSPKSHPSLDDEDLIKGNLLDNQQQSPLGSDNYFNISQPSGNTGWSFEDSYATYEQCTSTIQNVADKSSMKSPDELGKLAELVQKGTNFCTSDEFSNTLFSNLGLDQLLNGTTSSSRLFDISGVSNQSSSTTKRMRLESSLSGSYKQIMPSDLYSVDNNQNSVHTRDSLDETVTKFKTEKPRKYIKKKAKPGSRPIPKDRMLTYARLAELRELIPNGEKMSIDRLLQRTINQLHFLQSVTKHAKGLAKTELMKDRKDRKYSNNNIASGATWACEIENETIICPLIVEDLSTPGQMLIEILCQEQGFFMEIVDIIRGFGLNILRGWMEVHETKIRAHYIVEAEANRFVSRHEMFSSLVQILQLATHSESSANDHLGNVRDGGVSFLSNFPQPSFRAPDSVLDRIPCMGIL